MSQDLSQIRGRQGFNSSEKSGAGKLRPKPRIRLKGEKERGDGHPSQLENKPKESGRGDESSQNCWVV